MDDVIKVYGASWCPDCRRAKRFLGDQRISFEWHDIEVDPDGVRIGAGAQRRQQHHPDDRLPGRLPPVGALERGARREDRARAHGDDARLRPDHRRRRAGRAHDVDLRGPREPADARDRQQGPRRPGRRDRTSRQLPGVPRRDRRRRARRPDRAAGAALRRRAAPGGLGELDHERRRGGRRRDGDRATTTTRGPRSSRPARPTGGPARPARRTSSAPGSTSARRATARSTRARAGSSCSAAATAASRRGCSSPSSSSGSRSCSGATG